MLLEEVLSEITIPTNPIHLFIAFERLSLDNVYTKAFRPVSGSLW